MQIQGYLISSKKLSSLDERLTQINTLDELPDEAPLLVIFDFDEHITRASVVNLRRRSAYRYCPMYAWDSLPDDCDMMLDGVFDESAYHKAEQMHERLVLCQRHDKENGDEDNPIDEDTNIILCRYLFTRKKKGFLPEVTWKNKYGFSYPMLHALLAEGNANDHWYVLNALVKRGYLEISETPEEIQTCPGCEGGLLNFKNCCPNCESVDLHIEPFVHCFSCGNVGPIKEFMRHQELVCLRCQTTLKHIGIDYDKPLEDKICEHCQHRFFEPNTLFMCLTCDRGGDPGTLKGRKLSTFSLTKKGEQFAKNRLQKLAMDIGAFFDLINFNILELIIQWQARVSQRHEDVEFVAGVIFVDNIDALIQEIGFLKTEQQLVLFYENARSLFRKTDLLSVDDDKLFCFLTMTNLKYIGIIQERIKNFDKKAAPNAPTLNIKFGFLSSAEILEANLDKDLLINEMLNRVSYD